jgi:hypothetical protein
MRRKAAFHFHFRYGLPLARRLLPAAVAVCLACALGSAAAGDERVQMNADVGVPFTQYRVQGFVFRHARYRVMLEGMIGYAFPFLGLLGTQYGGGIGMDFDLAPERRTGWTLSPAIDFHRLRSRHCSTQSPGAPGAVLANTVALCPPDGVPTAVNVVEPVVRIGRYWRLGSRLQLGVGADAGAVIAVSGHYADGTSLSRGPAAAVGLFVGLRY